MSVASTILLVPAMLPMRMPWHELEDSGIAQPLYRTKYCFHGSPAADASECNLHLISAHDAASQQHRAAHVQ